MGFSPGEESRSGAVAAQAIEAQPSSGQISQREAAWFARTEQHAQEKTWRSTVTLHKGDSAHGEEKEAVAYQKAAHLD
jgi:hypothetical protein